jgi:osmotically-inducible protein OsmY
MRAHPILLALALVALPLGQGCSHHDEAAHARRASTSGSERARVEARHHDEQAHEEEIAAENGEAPTALDQSERVEDLEITREIRAAVVADSSLSFGARNCTIVTRDGVVTLRGDVSSNAERDAIDRHAHEAVGVDRVENLLAVPE